MDTKCKELAKALHTAAQASEEIAGGPTVKGLTDSYDIEICEVMPGKFVFGFDKWIDKPGKRRGRPDPLGHIIYTVTVEAEYQSFDEEESPRDLVQEFLIHHNLSDKWKSHLTYFDEVDGNGDIDRGFLFTFRNMKEVIHTEEGRCDAQTTLNNLNEFVSWLKATEKMGWI